MKEGRNERRKERKKERPTPGAKTFHRGFFGNARFKTQTQTAPRIANDGEKGEKLIVDLELKVLADVGLVGFPQQGCLK